MADLRPVPEDGGGGGGDDAPSSASSCRPGGNPKRFLGMSSFGPSASGGGGGGGGGSLHSAVSFRVSKMFRSRRSLNNDTSRGGSADDDSLLDDGDDSDSDDEETVDRRRIHRSVRDAGKYADGISAVEVWILDSATRKLVRPDGGWWRTTDFECATDAAEEALRRIEDETRADYVEAEPLLPGTGLAGKLWAESSSSPGGGGRASVGGLIHHWQGGATDAAAEHKEEEAREDGPPAQRQSAMEGLMRDLFTRTEGGDGSEEKDDEESIERAYGIKSKERGPGGGDIENPATATSPGPASSAPAPGDNDDNDSRKSHPRRWSSAEPGGQATQGQAGGRRSSRGKAQRSSSLSNRRRSSAHKQMMQRPDFRHFIMTEFRRNSSRRRSLSARNILNLPGVHQHLPALTWRNLASLSSDPDQPTFKRLALIEEAGFTEAAGVPFEARGGACKGIIVYLAKGDVDKNRLNAPANESYLLHAADMVGAAVALVAPRQKSLQSKEEQRSRMEDALACGPTKGKAQSDWEMEASHSCLAVGAKKVRAWGSKCRGGDLQPPPPMNTSQSLLTFFGACSTLLLLGWISERVSAVSDGQHHLILGPFGALMMLQYGLVMAPASQPRSAVLGQCVSLTVALSFAYIPEEAVPKYVRVALATSAAVALMVRLGVVHPPAAAAAAVVSGGVGGPHDWVTVPLFLFGNIIAIGTATVINNASDKRQYPTFWGGSFWAACTSACTAGVKSIKPFQAKPRDGHWEGDIGNKAASEEGRGTGGEGKDAMTMASDGDGGATGSTKSRSEGSQLKGDENV